MIGDGGKVWGVGMENGVQELLDNLAKVLGSRKAPVVICIVHSEAGLELLFNAGDLVMKLGMLEVARMTVVDQQARMNMEHEEECRRAGERAVAALGE